MTSEKQETVQMAHLGSLPALRRFIEDACRRASLDRATCFAFKLAVDEACTNIITHGYAGRDPGPIVLSFEREARRAFVTITDYGRRFDPADVRPPDLDAGWRERQAGGLGLHLIRQVMDDVSFTSADGSNRLTLVKCLDTGDRSGGTRMEISAAPRGQVTVLALAGSVDALSADEVAAAFGERVRAGEHRLVADLSRVDYLSSAGLRALLGALKETRQRGGDLRLAAAHDDVRRVLDLSGFTSILKLYPDVETAVTSFAG